MCARVFSAGCHYRSDVACERSSSPLDVKVHSRPLPQSSPLTPLPLPLPLPALTNVSSQKIMKPAYLHPPPPSTPARFQHPAAYAPAARTVRPNRSSRGRRQASEKKINGDAYSKSTLSATGRLRGVSSSPRRPARSIPPHTVTDSGLEVSLGLIAGQLVSRPRCETALVSGFHSGRRLASLLLHEALNYDK